MYITEAHDGKISVHRSGPGARAQTLRSEQTGGPISSVFAGGLAILLDTLFRSSDADADTDAPHRREIRREKIANGTAQRNLSSLRSDWRLTFSDKCTSAQVHRSHIARIARRALQGNVRFFERRSSHYSQLRRICVGFREWEANVDTSIFISLYTRLYICVNLRLNL